jgi:alpha-tubulin suppressor-like RCC1 family protein
VPVVGGLTFATIAAGQNTTCGLTTAGAAYCWGSNTSGERGDGTYGTSISTPTAVAGGHVFAGLTVGFQLTCGWTTAGAAYCWGNNYFGQSGDGTTAFSIVPALIPIGD